MFLHTQSNPYDSLAALPLEHAKTWGLSSLAERKEPDAESKWQSIETEAAAQFFVSRVHIILVSRRQGRDCKQSIKGPDYETLEELEAPLGGRETQGEVRSKTHSCA